MPGDKKAKVIRFRGGSEEIRNLLCEDDSSDSMPEAVEEEWAREQEDLIADENAGEEDALVSRLVNAFKLGSSVQEEASPSASPPASPPPSIYELQPAARPPASASPPASSSAPPPASPSAPPLPSSSAPPLLVSSDDDDDEYDLGPTRGKPPAKKRTDIPPETGSGGIGSTRKLVQPLSKRPKIPWEKTAEKHQVRCLDFKPTNPGIQVDIPDEFDEMDALMLFLPNDLWDTIATESNRYYRRKKEDAALKTDITPAEARAYVGIMILLGLSPPHSLRTPWKCESTFRNDIISSAMSYSRFVHINDNFHLVDNATLPPPDTIAYKTGRIAPLLNALKHRCRTVYKAETRQLAVDEGSMGWKGHSSMRQYNPNKPHKYHIKSYKLVETKTGYLSNIILHDTTSRTVDEVVLTLLDESPYGRHEGYAVFTDRFYTSPDLFWHLRTVQGFDATGTCMSNRHQFPPEIKNTKCKSKKGDVSSYTATQGDDSLVAMRWRDSKDVFMLSTEETAEKIECDSQRGRVRTMKPAMVPLYNKHMGGVDLNDYLESRYSPCRATRKMWKKLAMYLVSTAVTNAYIIFRMVCKDRNRKPARSPHFAFREALGNIMLMMCDTRPPPNAPVALQPAPIGIGHLPMSYNPLPQELQRSTAAGRDPRRPSHRCQMPGCDKKSIFYCAQCNVCLCMRAGRICFTDYHRQMKHRRHDEAGQVAAAHPPPPAPASAASSTTSSDADESAPRRILPQRSAKRKLTEDASQLPTSSGTSGRQSGTRSKKARLSGGHQ
jgi:hypothetical protein